MMQAATISDGYDAGLLWELPGILWSEITPLIKMSNRFLVGLSLGHVPPVWPVALDLVRIWQIT